MSKKVVIIDDVSYMREMIKDILSKDGYEIVGEVENAKEAMGINFKLKPDLLIMDITEKQMSSIDEIKELIEADQNVKILIISAVGQQAVVVNAIKAGARGFVVKPFKPEILLVEVDRIVNSK